MRSSQAQTMFERVRCIDREIETLLTVFKETEARVSAIAAETGADPNKYNEALQGLAVTIDNYTGELITAREAAVSEIMKLPSKAQRDVLILRYVAGYTLREIASELRYSVRQIQRLHKAALEALADG